jgi:hypothetical protein
LQGDKAKNFINEAREKQLQCEAKAMRLQGDNMKNFISEAREKQARSKSNAIAR